MKAKTIKGLVAAPFTPMFANGEINTAIIPDYYRQLKADGIRGGFVCGSAGEGVSMTLSERKEVAEAWRDCVDDDFALIVHIGALAWKDAKELAEHAERIGADAVGMVGPSYFRPSRVEDLIEYCQLVAAGCPNTPFYYYHIPGLSGINLPMDEFLRQGQESIPNLAGLKFTHHNMYELQQAMMVAPDRYNIMFGHDEVLMAGWTFGCTGAVGSLYNQMGKCFNRIWTCMAEGRREEALDLQHKSVLVVDLLLKYYGSVPCGKTMQTLIGIDCGPVRSPLRNLTPAEVVSLKNDLEAIGFFDWR
ncbi:MAG: dihydrodipicolinate synthase family protein [Planctomycetia bacterium]|nr:dihydrodipicolinate synthase family protein [Planctomycetia bacterium]